MTEMPVGPDSPAEGRKADAGRRYNALYLIGHQDCLWGLGDAS